MPFYQSIADILSENRQDKHAIRSRTEQIITTLDGLGRELSATVFLDAEFSLQQAKKRQNTDTDTTLPLYGVPLAHKELYGRCDTDAVWPNEGGSKSCKGQMATQTATTIAQLDQAGAIDCGRLVSVEYALGVTGHNAYAGTPKNPWNRDYVCGGSSSGSAAIVAAGIVPGALGSDTGGSIRLPAAACGLVGIKPTQGLVSRAGIFPLSASLDTAGPLTRSVEDSARILSCITGYDARDEMSLHTAKIDYIADLEAGLDGVRIGLPERYFLDGSDSDIADMIASVFDRLNQMGARGQDIEIAGIENTNPLNVLLIATEATKIHGGQLGKIHADLNAQTLMRILTGAFTSEADYARLLACRADYIARTLPDLFDKIDMFLTPVWPFALPTIEQSDVGSNPAAAALVQKIGHNTRPVNFLGLPAICLPIGRDKNGLPVSAQLVGKPFSEALLIRAARAIEREYRFWDSRPAFAETA